MFTVYTTPTCPRCKILKDKMLAKNVEFEECQDIEEMERLNIEEVPKLMVDDKLLSFGEAVNYIRGL